MEILRRSSFHENVGPKIPKKSLDSGENFPPPIFSRAPPDGHEFPPKYCEPLSLPAPPLPEKPSAMPAEASEARCSVGRSYSLSNQADFNTIPYREHRADTNGYHSNNKIEESVLRHNQKNSMDSMTMPSNRSNRWANEENVPMRTSHNGRLFSRRESEKAPSVRDRIALFSKPDQVQPEQTPPPIPSYSKPVTTNSKKESKMEYEDNYRGNVSNGVNGTDSNIGFNGFVAAVPVSTKEYKIETAPMKPNPSTSTYNENIKPQMPLNDLVSQNSTFRRESTPGYTSSYPQTQLTNHLRYSYAGQKSLDDYKRSNANGGSYTSVLDARRHSATKLKGLVIPDRPSLHSSAGNPLPTIVNNKQLAPPRSGQQGFSPPTNTTHWYQNGPEPKSLNTSIENISKANGNIVLSEPPWKAMPSYETQILPQVYKSRPLELPRSFNGGGNTASVLTCSVSPTPPSSLTSPLSPPPSSPSSICSSNTSSSCGISKQSTFQFSLSHSKPVTPTLPEKPILVSPTPSNASSIVQPENDIVYSEKTFYVNQPSLPETGPPPLPSSEPPNKATIKKQNLANNNSKSSSDISSSKPQTTKLSALDRLDSLVSFSYPVKVSSETSSDCVIPQRSLDATPLAKEKSLTNQNTLIEQSVTREEVSLSMNANGYSENGRMSSNSSVLSTTHSDNRVWSSRPASESDDDTNSVISLRTEDSRQTADDSLSDTTTDSLDRGNHDPEFKPRRISQQRTVLRARMDSTDSVKNFRALAERWELRAGDEPISRTTSNGPLPPGPTSLVRRDSGRSTSSSATEGSVKLPPSLMPRCSDSLDKGAPLSLPSNNRSSTVSGKYKYNDSTDSLLTERTKRLSSLERSVSSFALDMVGGGNNDSRTRSRSSTLGPIGKSNRSVSVSDIRKTFEIQNGFTTPEIVIPATTQSKRDDTKNNQTLTTQPTTDRKSASTLICPTEVHHKRFSSIDSTASDSGVSTPAHYGSSSSLAAPSTGSRDLFGSVTSLASTSSLISAQELQQLIDEANQSLSEEHVNTTSHEITVVVLHKDTLSGSIGITLAGGADYEIKEITVHKVILGSLADRDGRLRKGDRIISINGRNLKGVTHREALDILKSPRQEVVLVTSRERVPNSQNSTDYIRQHSSSVSQVGNPVTRTERTVSLPNSLHAKAVVANSVIEKTNSTSTTATTISPEVNHSNKGPRSGTNVTMELIKDGTGLGFSLEGGKDSPLGDKPLMVKRVFKGGAADRQGNLEMGDEILSVNKQSVSSMTRTEAWNFMKKLPDGPVNIVVKKV